MKVTQIPRDSFPAYLIINVGKHKGKKININLSYLNYATKVNLDTLEYGKDCNGVEINDLIRDGKVTDCDYCELGEIGFDYGTMSLNKEELKNVQDELTHKCGMKISMSAIKYCYTAWKQGFKSGYRGKGFHLFAPSGSCNPLSFRVTKLDKHYRDWQITYTC